MNEGDVERCKSCIIPRLTKNVEFDDNNICEICNKKGKYNVAKKDLSIREKELHNYIRKIKELGKEQFYDCLVGVSGGRDSSYLLYLLVKKYNLRCLAAYYRTPFTPNEIESNVRKMVEKLDVPIEEIKISTEFHQKIAREMIILWKKQPHPLITNLICAPCKLVNREVFKIARKNNIHAIVFGGNPCEAFQFGSATVNTGFQN